MNSKVADVLIPLTWRLTRMGQYVTRKAEDWRIYLLVKYDRI